MNGTFCLFGVQSRVYSNIHGLGTIIGHTGNESTPYQVQFDNGETAVMGSNSFELRRHANGDWN